MVQGRGSCPESREFESCRRILDGHFSHLFVVKLEYFIRKAEINKKEAGVVNF